MCRAVVGAGRGAKGGSGCWPDSELAAPWKEQDGERRRLEEGCGARAGGSGGARVWGRPCCLSIEASRARKRAESGRRSGPAQIGSSLRASSFHLIILQNMILGNCPQNRLSSSFLYF